MTRVPSLDSRLSAAADMFPACERGADIGTDHGRLSCYLLASGRCGRMTVSDVSADSLKKARTLISLHNLSDRADYRIADGLDALEEPAQAVAICGIGGVNAAEILRRGYRRLYEARLILSVNTDLPRLRRTLTDIGYILSKERAVTVAGRYYVVMQAETGKAYYTDREYFLGPQLLKCENEISLHYFYHLYHAVSQQKGDHAVHCLQWIEEVLSHASGNSTNDSGLG